MLCWSVEMKLSRCIFIYSSIRVHYRQLTAGEVHLERVFLPHDILGSLVVVLIAEALDLHLLPRYRWSSKQVNRTLLLSNAAHLRASNISTPVCSTLFI